MRNGKIKEKREKVGNVGINDPDEEEIENCLKEVF